MVGQVLFRGDLRLGVQAVVFKLSLTGGFVLDKQAHKLGAQAGYVFQIFCQVKIQFVANPCGVKGVFVEGDVRLTPPQARAVF